MIRTTIAFNQVRLRKILAYSSINHIAWLLSSIIISFSIWLIYIIIYTLINIKIIFFFKKSNSFYFKQLINYCNNNKILNFIIIINFISLIGLPPFIGFLPKWLTINFLIFNKFFILTFLLIVITLVIIYIYIQLILSSLIINFMENKLFIKYKRNFLFINLNFFLSNNLIIFIIILNIY